MRVVSLPRFRPGPFGARALWFVLLLSAALIVLLAFGATGVAASDVSHPIDPGHPFRW